MTLRNLKALIKNEAAGYLYAPVAYVFLFIFLLLAGAFTFQLSGFFANGQATLRDFFFWHPWLYLILVPAIGMRLWSDERRAGTMELLFTMPVTVWQCIVAKFTAAWLCLALALLLTFPMILTVTYLGDPDMGAIWTAYLGSFLMAGAYLSISSFTSAISRSQVVAFIIAVVICIVGLFIGYPPVTDFLVHWAPNWLVQLMGSLSLLTHFDALQRGVIDFTDVLYYFSVIGFFLFLTAVTLKNRRSN